MTHPSFLALDRLALGGGVPEDRQHADGCAQCGAYLARLEAPAPVPDAVRALARPRWARWAVGGLATAVATSLAVAAVVAQQPAEEVRRKGSPVASVFIRRGEAVMRWDGVAAVRAGDALRLEVQPEGFARLMVLEGATPLFDGAVEAPRHALPLSWRVDDAPAAVELRLVFSRAPLTADQALDEWARGTRSAETWVTTLRLPRAVDAPP